MLKSRIFKVMGVAALFTTIIIAGCGGDEEKSKPLTERIIEDTVEAIGNEMVDAAFAQKADYLAAEPAELNITEAADIDFNEVNDILVNDSLLYAAYDEGLVIYDFTMKKSTLLDTGERFNALAFYDGELYAGGEKLYNVKGQELIPADAEFEGEVTALYSDSFRLLIGTRQGLFSKSPFGQEKLMDDVAVNDLQFDNDGLWVATDGEGLYRWDGDRFRQRYLLRDTTIFDTVYDLDFNRDLLYVAAKTGFFVFDGGNWEHWTDADGLPATGVKAVNAGDWMVQVGTEKGMVAYFNHDLYPVKKLDTVEANVIRLLDKKVIVGTRQGEVLMKAGNFVTALIEQTEPEGTPEVFSLADEETPAE